MNGILENLSDLLSGSPFLAPLIALLAGALTSLMPCALASIPLVIGFVSSDGKAAQDRRRPLKLSLTFALGLTLTFTALGAIAATAGVLMGSAQRWWYLALGVLMVLMALQTWELFTFIKPSYLMARTGRQGYAGALIAGALGGLFSSPCATPVLIALLALVAGQGQFLWGLVLLLFYAAGHSALSVLAGASTGFARRITTDSRYGKLSLALKIILGALILLMGLYFLYLAF